MHPRQTARHVIAQYVRCGNRDCKCYRGKLHKQYVRTACVARQHEEHEMRAILAQSAQPSAGE